MPIQPTTLLASLTILILTTLAPAAQAAVPPETPYDCGTYTVDLEAQVPTYWLNPETYEPGAPQDLRVANARAGGHLDPTACANRVADESGIELRIAPRSSAGPELVAERFGALDFCLTLRVYGDPPAHLDTTQPCYPQGRK